ncbi:MAG TPA: DUF167 domain-containing protein [Candidatus Babeliales bacterium]|jgi:hypothetical protein|nr:DUF167 domain-containing protein [Candidatus Babeliales bacterium]
MAFTCIIKVTPSSGRSYCILDKSNRLHCYVKNPPEYGKANQEIMTLIAKALHIPTSMVSIIMGASIRIKTIKIASNHTYEQLLHALGIERQASIFT